MLFPSSWRQFQLFDFLPIRDPHYKSASPLFSDPSLTAISATESYIVYAVNDGYIKILRKSDLSLVKQFAAYDPDYTINFIDPLLHSNLVVTLAERPGMPLLLKIWDISKIVNMPDSVTDSEDTMRHKFITTVAINDTDNLFPISYMLFNDSLTCVAIGYANGNIILVRGDLLRDRGSKQRVVYEGLDPVTGIHFSRNDEIIYVVTTSRVFTLLTTGRNKGKPLRVLSNNSGAGLGCSDVDARSSKLILANAEGFTYYTHVNKALTVRFESPKKLISWLFRDYLLVVCPIEDPSSAGKSFSTRILILDMRNMHVAFTLNIPNLTIARAFASSSEEVVYLQSTDGVLYKLHEKPINQQVELISQRDLYTIALNLAKQHNLSDQITLQVTKAHAEYSYKSQDYESSINSYSDCLALFLSPPRSSESKAPELDDFVISVITKFKEVSHINLMTRFLETLHRLQLADGGHITLLLCCYCRLKKTEALDSFIEQLPQSGTTEAQKLVDFTDVDYTLLINVFIECQFYPQVILLLHKLNRPRELIDIQLRDLNQTNTCISYMRSLPVADLLGILIDYSKDLLDAVPLEATKLLIEVFTGKYKPQEVEPLDEEMLKKEEPETEKPQESVSSYSAFLSYFSLNLGDSAQQEAVTPSEPTYLPPLPSLVFACFMDHPKEFLVFLEACYQTLDKFQGSVTERQNLVTTLFEMYLSLYLTELEDQDQWREKAVAFLKENIELMNVAKALLICNAYSSDIADLLLEITDENYEEYAFRKAETEENCEKAMSVVREYGEKKPVLYRRMLRLISSSQLVLAPKDVRFLLGKLKEHKLAEPLEVIKILGQSQFTTVGLIKDYLIEHIDTSRREIAKNEKLMESYEKESTKYSVELSELTEKPVIFKAQKCSSCELKLEFPLVYFKCQHSYHQKCLDENNYIPGTGEDQQRCPLCVAEVKRVQDGRNRRAEILRDESLFNTKLEQSDDVFKVVSDYIARGGTDVVDDIPDVGAADVKH